MDLDVIYNEDCLVGMTRLPDRSVDMVLCDLPYGTTQNKWDSVINLGSLWTQYRRAAKENAAIVLTTQMPFTITLAASNLPFLKYEWVWDKVNRKTGHLNAKKQPLKVTESALVFYYQQCIYNPQMTTGRPYKAVSKGNKSRNYGSQSDGVVTINNGEYYPTNLISIEADERGTVGRLHPTQKPVALFEYLIRTYTNEGETVLDNCIGSGTTAIGCINSNRHYIGFEKDTKYFQIAKDRIASHSQQLSLAVA